MAATRRMSTVVAIEGDKEYKKALSALNAELKSLSSQMRLVTAEYATNANSEEALQKKGEALRGVIDAQQKKVETLTAAMKNAQMAQGNWANKAEQAKQALAGTTDAVSKLDKNALKNAETYRSYQNQLSAATVQLERLERGSEDASEAKEELKRKISELQVKMSDLETATDGEVKRNAELITQHERLSRELETANDKMATAQNAANRYQAQINNAKTELVGLDGELRKNDQYLKEAQQSADRCATSIDRFGKETKQAGEDSREGANGFDKVGQSASSLESLLLASGIQHGLRKITDALQDCVKVSADFAYTMSTVRAVTGAGGEDMAALSAQAKQYAASTIYFAQDIADAYATMGRAGFTAAEMLSALPGTVALASSSGEDLAAVTSTLADNLTAFGDGAEQAARYADVMSETAASSNTTVAQLSDAFTMAASTAGTLGYRIEDVSVWLGTMANQGVKGSMAGSAVTTALSRMAGGTQAAADKLKALGIDMFDAQGNARKLGDFLGDLRAAFAGLTQEEAENTATTLAGIRGKKALLALVNTSTEDWNALTEAINHSSGAAERMADIQLDNYSGQVQLLQSAAEELKITIGDQLTPALGDLAEIGTDVLTGISSFLKENKSAVPIIGGTVTAIATFTGVLTVATAAVKLFDIAAKTLSTTFKTSFGTVATVIGLISTAVGFLSAAFLDSAADSESAAAKVEAAADKWEEAKEAYQSTMEEIKTESDEVDRLIDELYHLADGTKASALEQDRIRQIVDILNQKVPELALNYDALTNSMNVSDKEAQAYADYLESKNELDARQKQLKVAQNLVEEAGSSVQEAFAANKAAEEDFANYTPTSNDDPYYRMLAQNVQSTRADREKAWSLYLGLVREKNTKQSEYQKAYADAEETQEKLEKIQTSQANAGLEQLAQTAKKADGSAQDLSDTYAVLSAQFDNLKLHGSQANIVMAENELHALHQRAIVQELEATYGQFITHAGGNLETLSRILAENEVSAEDWSKAFEENISKITNGFDKLNLDTEADLDEIKENLTYNIEAYRTWQENLDFLRQEAISRNSAAGLQMVQDIASMGIAAGAGYAQAMVDSYEEVFDEIVPLYEEAGDLAVQTTNRQFGYIPTIVENSANDAMDAFCGSFETRMVESKRAMKQTARETAQGAAEEKPEFSKAGSGLGGSFASGISSQKQNVKSKVDELIGEVNKSFEQMDTHKSGENAANGLIDGILSKRDAIINTARGVVRDVLSAIRSAGGEHSPWATTRRSGRFAAEGLALGMRENAGSVLRAALDVTQAAIGGLDMESIWAPTAATRSAAAYYKRHAANSADGRSDVPNSITTHVYIGNRQVAEAVTDQVITEINGRIVRETT